MPDERTTMRKAKSLDMDVKLAKRLAYQSTYEGRPQYTILEQALLEYFLAHPIPDQETKK